MRGWLLLLLLCACGEPARPGAERPLPERFDALASFAVTLEESLLNADLRGLLSVFHPDVLAAVAVPAGVTERDAASLRREALTTRWEALLAEHPAVEIQMGALETVALRGDRVPVPVFRRYAGGEARPHVLDVVWRDGRFGLDAAGEQALVNLMLHRADEQAELDETAATLARCWDRLQTWRRANDGRWPARLSTVWSEGEEPLVDAWGSVFELRQRAGAWELLSPGPDGEPETLDDLVHPPLR